MFGSFSPNALDWVFQHKEFYMTATILHRCGTCGNLFPSLTELAAHVDTVHKAKIVKDLNDFSPRIVTHRQRAHTPQQSSSSPTA